jgi:hypothetical protein
LSGWNDLVAALSSAYEKRLGCTRNLAISSHQVIHKQDGQYQKIVGMGEIGTRSRYGSHGIEDDIHLPS